MADQKLSIRRGTYLGSASGYGRFLVNQNVVHGTNIKFTVDVTDWDNMTIILDAADGAAQTMQLDFYVVDSQDVPVDDSQSPNISMLAFSSTDFLQKNVSNHTNVIARCDLKGVQVVEIVVRNTDTVDHICNWVDVLCGVTGVAY